MKTRSKVLRAYIKAANQSIKAFAEEEKRAEPGSKLQKDLRRVRKGELRDRRRHMVIAYGFLRNVPLSKIEPESKKPINWQRVAMLIEEFGITTFDPKQRQEQGQRFKEWRRSYIPSAV